MSRISTWTKTGGGFPASGAEATICEIISCVEAGAVVELAAFDAARRRLDGERLPPLDRAFIEQSQLPAAAQYVTETTGCQYQPQAGLWHLRQALRRLLNARM